jgi:hypothetical protein
MFQRSSVCRECGARLSWARSEAGKWLPMEVEPFSGKDVPARHRMTVQGGTAVATPRATQVCVVTHFVVCPARIRHLEFLKQTWPALGARAERHQLIRGAGRRAS